MAELVIMATTPEPEEESNDLRYKAGDVVAVYPDGTCTEEPSENSLMTVIRIDGLSVEDASSLLDGIYVEVEDSEGKTRRDMTHKRKYNISLDSLPSAAASSKSVASVQSDVPVTYTPATYPLDDMTAAITNRQDGSAGIWP